MQSYATSIEITENVRLDLFTENMFRIRVSHLHGERFPEKYEIPFAVGKVTPWEEVPYTIDRKRPERVCVKTASLVIWVQNSLRLPTGVIVESPDGKRLYPTDDPVYGMFKNHCIVFDAASFHNEYSQCSRFPHWFWNPETGRYDTLLKEDHLLEYYFICGKTYREGYALFNTLVGSEPLPPKKSFGYFQTQHLSEKGTQKLLLETARLLREKHIPCDTLIVDFEWGDGITDGKQNTWGSSLDFCEAYKTPYSPAEMIAKLKEDHFDVMLIHHSIPEYEGRLDESWVNWRSDADEWWAKMHELLDMGVVGTWQDTRRNDFTDSRIYLGMQEYLGKKQRCSFLKNYDFYYDCSWTKESMMSAFKQRIGGRRTPFGWTGDCRTKTWEDLAFQVKGTVNTEGALKGVSYITNDGFHPGGVALAVRNDQFLAFNSILRSHTCKPWESPGNPDSIGDRMAIGMKLGELSSSEKDLLGLSSENLLQEDILRKIYRLRYRLLPYIYTVARACYDTGLPFTRPLMTVFEEDKNCNKNQYPYEYMFGDAFLVSPVITDAETADVYLPGGNWISFFTEEIYPGGQTVRIPTTDLRTFPLFVKEGSVIPMEKEKEYITPGDDAELFLHVYGKNAEGSLYEDDGCSLGYTEGAFAFTDISYKTNGDTGIFRMGKAGGSYEGQRKERTVHVLFHGVTRMPASVDNAESTEMIGNALCVTYVHSADREDGFSVKF